MLTHLQNSMHLEIASLFPCFLHGKLDWGFEVGSVQFSSVQSLSHVQLFATPWTAAHQASLSIINSWSLLMSLLMSIESVMPSNRLILCRPLPLLPSIFPSIRIFSNESVLCIRRPKYWNILLCESQKTVENSSRDGNTRPPDLPLEKSACRSRSNS